MKTVLKVFNFVLVFSMLLAACAPQATEVPTAAPEAEKGPLKVALVLAGVVTDNGFNAAAYRGLKAAEEEYGVEIAYSESVPLAEYESAIRDYANKGFDLVIAHGSQFGDALLTVSAEFPDTYFAGTNCFVKGPNLAGLDTRQEEAGFVMGVIAGQLTKAKKIGWVGSKEILSFKRDVYGFEEGVKVVCPDCEVMIAWVGSFDDVNKGKENALALIDKGADVLTHNADAAGLGVLAAAKEKNVLALGNVGDQKDQAPDQIVTSMVRALSPVVKAIVTEIVGNNFQADTIRVYGYVDDLYSLTGFNTKLITQEQIDVTNEWVEKVKAGDVPLEHILPDSAPAPTAAPAADAKPLKVALVLGGVVTDNGFGAAAYRGLKAAEEEYGVETAYSESVPLAEYENAIRDYANKGFDLVIAHGSEFGDALKIVSAEFPDTYFAGTNCFVKGPNLAGLDTKQEEAGFIMGVIAGQLTKAKKIGWVGAKEILSMKRDVYGFEEGVKVVCPDCEVMTAWVGSFDDVNKGKENALALIDKGADVMVHNADAAGLGVLAAAKEKKVLAIGNVGDQKDQAPDQIVTSLIRAMSPVVKAIVKEVVDNDFQADTIRVYGFNEDLYMLTDFNTNLITQEQIDVTNEWIKKVKAGDVPLEHIVP